ncbi:MAG: hypothetical protein ABIP13_06975 [Tepidiformaceae bacterium]
MAENHGDDLAFYQHAGRQQSWQTMQLGAYRRSQGVAQEMTLPARPWGFELKEIKGKVLRWRGDESAALANAARKIAASLAHRKGSN